MSATNIKQKLFIFYLNQILPFFSLLLNVFEILSCCFSTARVGTMRRRRRALWGMQFAVSGHAEAARSDEAIFHRRQIYLQSELRIKKQRRPRRAGRRGRLFWGGGRSRGRWASPPRQEMNRRNEANDHSRERKARCAAADRGGIGED